jgi:nucleotide-binding universal stress UspA family protein
MNTIEITPGAIVVAIDGSENALTAVQWAAWQARLEGRSLVLAHAVGHESVRPTTLRTVGDGDDVTWVDDSFRASHLIVEEATDCALAIAPAVPVHGVSVPGEPRQALEDLSGSAHLLVLGSRGRGIVRSRLLGSVSAAVAKTAKCPIVVVRPHAPGKLKDGVVVAADATPESLPVLEFAFRQAALQRVPLTVMHCLYAVPVAAAGMGGGAIRVLPDAEEHARMLAESIAGLPEKYPDVRFTQRLERGLVDECLTSNPRPWNLVVVGRHPVRGWLAGSTGIGVMEHAHSPVAIVPEAESTL